MLKRLSTRIGAHFTEAAACERVPKVMGGDEDFWHMHRRSPVSRMSDKEDVMQLLADGSSIIKDTWPHTVNVIAHVVFGTLALLLGLVQLVTKKGGASHRARGRWFLGFVWIVVGTATTGLVLFRPRADPVAVTLLTAYWAYSGLRALRTRHVGPVAQDALVSICVLVASVLLVLYLQRVRVPWAPAVVYSTLGTLVLLALYDLARFAFPTRWFETLWLYEHLLKMIGAHSSVITAFSGTVLWAWQPYSQLVPSTLWVAVMIGYVVRIRRRAASRPRGVSDVAAASR
jgi:uncharacterized membrane protein